MGLGGRATGTHDGSSDDVRAGDTLESTETAARGGLRPSGARIRIAVTAPEDAREIAQPPEPDWAHNVRLSAEAARTRGFARMLVAFCVIGLICQPALGGALWLHVVMVATLVVLGLFTCYVALRARDPERYTRPWSRTFAIACLLSSVVVYYYLGVFSPAPMFLGWGVAFFARSEDRFVALGLSTIAAGIYSLTAGLVVLGVLPDDGAVQALSAPALARAPMIVMVPLVLAATIWQGRRGRASAIAAIDRADEAARWARGREAMLEEVQNELDALRSANDPRGLLVGTYAGNWRLDELVGAGGMGEVYAATHRETSQRAAVKVLSSRRLADPVMLRRFLREGQAALKLDVPNVVFVHEVGQTQVGVPFIAMELLEGHDLSHVLRERGRLSVDETIDLVSQVARGLEAAHAAGIVHRDLKPQNLFYCAGGAAQPTWKILDFGISKWDKGNGTITQHRVIGTPSYMSPEQARGVEADARSDLFSLAVVAYRAMTGHRPFAGPGLPQIMFEVAYGSPPRPTALVPTLHPDVNAFFAIALAKKREERFQSAPELLHALRRASFGALGDGARARAAKLVEQLPWR